MVVFGVGIEWEQGELLWAAARLYVATGGEDFKAYIGAAQAFSWDNKLVGAQTLVSNAS
jgi:endoglucanase